MKIEIGAAKVLPIGVPLAMTTKRHAKLTDFEVSKATAPIAAPNYIIWDSQIPGFGIRIGAKARTWFVAYRLPSGKQRRFKLGNMSSMGAEEARRQAKARLGKVASGADPAKERAEERRRSKSQVGDLLDQYLKQQLADGVVAARQEHAALKAGFGAKLLQYDLKDIDRRELVEAMDRVAKRARERTPIRNKRPSTGEGARGYFRKCTHAFLQWCVNRGLIFANPLAGFRAKRNTNAEKNERQDAGRALSQGELGAVWRASDPSTTFGRLVRFIMLSGVRREEAASLQWSWIDSDVALIRIPASATKMAREHSVPVTGAMAQLLSCSPRTMSKLVFPAARVGRGKVIAAGEEGMAVKISGWSKLVPKLAAKAGVDFSLHDLRRSLKTHVRELGFDSDISGLLVGHARNNFEARYDKSQLLAERFKAAEAYAAFILAGTLADTSVVQFVR